MISCIYIYIINIYIYIHHSIYIYIYNIYIFTYLDIYIFFFILPPTESILNPVEAMDLEQLMNRPQPKKRPLNRPQPKQRPVNPPQPKKRPRQGNPQRPQQEAPQDSDDEVVPVIPWMPLDLCELRVASMTIPQLVLELPSVLKSQSLLLIILGNSCPLRPNYPLPTCFKELGCRPQDKL